MQSHLEGKCTKAVWWRRLDPYSEDLSSTTALHHQVPRARSGSWCPHLITGWLQGLWIDSPWADCSMFLQNLNLIIFKWSTCIICFCLIPGPPSHIYDTNAWNSRISVVPSLQKKVVFWPSQPQLMSPYCVSTWISAWAALWKWKRYRQPSGRKEKRTLPCGTVKHHTMF